MEHERVRKRLLLLGHLLLVLLAAALALARGLAELVGLREVDRLRRGRRNVDDNVGEGSLAAELELQLAGLGVEPILDSGLEEGRVDVEARRREDDGDVAVLVGRNDDFAVVRARLEDFEELCGGLRIGCVAAGGDADVDGRRHLVGVREAEALLLLATGQGETKGEAAVLAAVEVTELSERVEAGDDLLFLEDRVRLGKVVEVGDDAGDARLGLELEGDAGGLHVGVGVLEIDAQILVEEGVAVGGDRDVDEHAAVGGNDAKGGAHSEGADHQLRGLALLPLLTLLVCDLLLRRLRLRRGLEGLRDAVIEAVEAILELEAAAVGDLEGVRLLLAVHARPKVELLGLDGVLGEQALAADVDDVRRAGEALRAGLENVELELPKALRGQGNLTIGRLESRVDVDDRRVLEPLHAADRALHRENAEHFGELGWKLELEGDLVGALVEQPNLLFPRLTDADRLEIDLACALHDDVVGLALHGEGEGLVEHSSVGRVGDLDAEGDVEGARAL